ncbi:MAG: amidohydrolase [Anaerolineae bacterium]|nr:amidohydrolase [Anaerolineae bacterium]
MPGDETSMLAASEVRAEAEALRSQLVAWRRDFHRHPELSLQEHRSAEVVADHLRCLGWSVLTGVATTGVVALLEGSRPGPVVMLRFDMDALPIHEANDVEYASQNPGVMHACGHDAHMAMGLGLATLMAGRRQAMAGTLKLVFQPAEEALDGAELMLQAGVLEDPRPDFFLAAHVLSDLPAGTVDVLPGPVMAASDTWTCTVHGTGGHGARPHETADPIVAAAHIITALQTVVSRNVEPLEAAVVTVGSIHGGQAHNIIPAQVDLLGTIRTFSPEVREVVQRRLREVVTGVAQGLGARAELEFPGGTPAVVNDASLAEVVRGAAVSVVGEQNVTASYRTTGSEDAAFYLQQVPGCYFFLGAGNAGRGISAPHHNPHFDIDEDVLPIGVAVFATALAELV